MADVFLAIVKDGRLSAFQIHDLRHRSSSPSYTALHRPWTLTDRALAVAVAAQIPCQYCIYAHTLGAKHAGATDAQIKEAVGAAALVRKWSTELNGNQYDMADFKKQVDAIYAGAKTQ
jgi:AhpD family alkylhydroperoxidase